MIDDVADADVVSLRFVGSCKGNYWKERKNKTSIAWGFLENWYLVRFATLNRSSSKFLKILAVRKLTKNIASQMG